MAQRWTILWGALACVGLSLSWSRPTYAANMAVSLDGIDDHLYVPGTAALHPTSQVALEAWVKLTTTDVSGSEIISIGDRCLLRVQTDGLVSFTIYYGTGWRGLSANGGNVKDGLWHHVLGQKTSSALQIYVDGVSRGSISNSDTISYPTGDLYIGRHGNGGTAYDFKGLIDEVRVYNRALTSNEIAAHYNGGAGQYGAAESGLVGGWPLDEGAGTTATDYSGNGQTATLKNGTAWATGLVAAGTPQVVATPTITPAGGTFTGSVQVTLATSTTAATIRYTTDGTGPTSTSPSYTAPFTLTSSATVNAKAFKSGMTDSAVASATFTVNPADTTPPTGTITINGGAATTNTAAVTLTLSATDNAGLVSQMQFSNDGTAYSSPEAYATSKSWTLATGDATKTVYAKFKDAAGNWSAAVTDTIVLDTAAPVISTVNSSGITPTAAAVTWITNEPATSQVDYGQTAAYGQTTTLDSTLVTSHTVSLSGLTAGTVYHYRVRAKDVAGNEAIGVDASFTTAPPPDTTPPTGSVTINGGAPATNNATVTLTLSATDNVGAVAQMQFSNDGATYTPAEAYATTKTWTLPAGDGLKTVYVKFKDAAGNWSTAASATITLDTTPPTLQFVTPKDGDVLIAPTP